MPKRKAPDLKIAPAPAAEPTAPGPEARAPQPTVARIRDEARCITPRQLVEEYMDQYKKGGKLEGVPEPESLMIVGVHPQEDGTLTITHAVAGPSPTHQMVYALESVKADFLVPAVLISLMEGE